MKFITKNGKKIPIGDSKGKMPEWFNDPKKRAEAEKALHEKLDNTKAQNIKDRKITVKQFADSGNYLEDEVRSRAKKGSPHFFDADTMRYFGSRVSELMWKKGNDIYFITSEKDSGSVQHRGSTRRFTVRKIDAGGDIKKVTGSFQEFDTLAQARSEIKDKIGLGD